MATFYLSKQDYFSQFLGSWNPSPYSLENPCLNIFMSNLLLHVQLHYEYFHPTRSHTNTKSKCKIHSVFIYTNMNTQQHDLV